ncbi:hypothetical protein ACV3BX_007168, partial [Pseudomonas aeruginosa]
ARVGLAGRMAQRNNRRTLEMTDTCEELKLLRNLLSRWLSIDSWEDSQIAPLPLVESTREALKGSMPESTVVVLISGGCLQGVWSDVQGLAVELIDRDNEAAGDPMPDLDEVTQGLRAVW